MRIFLWHGYLLGGTGSNVYTRSIAREWSRVGHDVVVVCQEPNPELYDLGGARVVRPNIGGLLPVFVLDRYRVWTRSCSSTAPSSSTRCVATKSSRTGGGTLCETLAQSSSAAHIREVLEEVVGHVDGVHELPPGADVEEFRPEPREPALRRLLKESLRDPPNPVRAPSSSASAITAPSWRPWPVRMSLFTGPLEHRHLVHLIPLTDVTFVPSIFSEAFGMVATEAAAGGSIPLVARHSGLAEIAEALGSDLTSFDTGDVADLRAKLERLLALSLHERDELKQRARRVTEERWSWAHVADRLLEPFT